MTPCFPTVEALLKKQSDAQVSKVFKKIAVEFGLKWLIEKVKVTDMGITHVNAHMLITNMIFTVSERSDGNKFW